MLLGCLTLEKKMFQFSLEFPLPPHSPPPYLAFLPSSSLASFHSSVITQHFQMAAFTSQ